jgi:hypothetical protein
MSRILKPKNKMNMKNLIKYGFIAVVSCFLLWLATSSTIQRFKCKEMTETEILLHIPKSFLCDWDNCN